MNTTSYWAHNGFFGFLNYSKAPKFNPEDPLDRPPFPSIKHEPTIGDVLTNFSKAEAGILFFGGAIAHCVAYATSAVITSSMPAKVNLSEYFTIRKSIFIFSRRTLLSLLPPLMYLNSLARLRGVTYNGLEWKTKLNRFAKFNK